jgi:hypothetical protein
MNNSTFLYWDDSCPRTFLWSCLYFLTSKLIYYIFSFLSKPLGHAQGISLFTLFGIQGKWFLINIPRLLGKFFYPFNMGESSVQQRNIFN